MYTHTQVMTSMQELNQDYGEVEMENTPIISSQETAQLCMS